MPRISIFRDTNQKKMTIEPKRYTAMLLHLFVDSSLPELVQKNVNWKMAQGCWFSPNQYFVIKNPVVD